MFMCCSKANWYKPKVSGGKNRQQKIPNNHESDVSHEQIKFKGFYFHFCECALTFLKPEEIRLTKAY